VITKAATLQCVSAQKYWQQQLPGVLCLERNFIIPQTLGLSAAAQSLANPAGSSGTFFVYEKHISVQSFTVLNGSSFREVPLQLYQYVTTAPSLRKQNILQLPTTERMPNLHLTPVCFKRTRSTQNPSVFFVILNIRK